MSNSSFVKYCCQELGCGAFLNSDKDVLLKKFGSVVPCPACGALYYKHDLSIRVLEENTIKVFYINGAISRINEKNEIIVPK